MVIEASEGDYSYVFEHKTDGTCKCTRMPIDDKTNCEELSDWSQLPPGVRTAFARAQHPAAG